MMKPRVISDHDHFQLTIDRLCHQLIENHRDFSNTCIIGVQPRGIHLSNRIVNHLNVLLDDPEVQYGKLDVSFYRDDFRRGEKLIKANDTTIEFSIEDKQVILVDDVLFTGRTIRASMDALLDFGRPAKIELLVLVDRRLSRHVPVQADYIGMRVDAVRAEYIMVDWMETAGKDTISILEEKDH